MADTLNYIPQGVEDIYDKYNRYYQEKGVSDINRNSLVSGRRTSDLGAQEISKFNQEYGLGASMGLANLSMTGASAAQNEAMVWGGLSPFTGKSITGQNPWAAGESEKDRTWKSGESEIERLFKKQQYEAEYAAAKDNAEKQAGASIWGGIFGGLGSLIGGIL